MQTARQEGLRPVHLFQKDTLFKMLSRDFPYLKSFKTVTLFGDTCPFKPSLITEVSLLWMGHKFYNCLGGINSHFLLTKKLSGAFVQENLLVNKMMLYEASFQWLQIFATAK